MKRIVESEFVREQVLIENGHPGLAENLFGDACDRESWVRVRGCWK